MLEEKRKFEPQDVSRGLKEYYNSKGWQMNAKGLSTDAIANEDLREVAEVYVSKCRLRILRYLPKIGNKLLDVASGPIQYKEYLTYSDNFKKRHCIDLSEKAIQIAKEKLGDHGEYSCGDFLELDINKESYDGVISIHTLYHLHVDKQLEMVNKLLDVSIKGSPVVIVYSNPNYFFNIIAKCVKGLFRIKKNEMGNEIYFFSHSISFWKQFKDRADYEIFPWRSLSSRHQRLLIPNNKIGKAMFKLLFNLEDLFPNFFIRFFKFYTVVLKKRSTI
jgi:2-polyprenyl-3-methyl-5-hydroxy-6-metoxy-1,4-benzoquinol methylase